MLTVKKIRELLTDFFLESLALDSGIVEFFGIDKYSIAISYETGDKSDLIVRKRVISLISLMMANISTLIIILEIKD